jgi:uncharacterized surface protein with fasciclin (FAS1) repeats
VRDFYPKPAAPAAAPAPDPLGWGRFVADVLGSRAAGGVPDSVSVAFFNSLLRAVSWGEAPDIGGPYTLFLPVDSAFSRFPGEALDAVVHDRAALAALVDAHIVPGTVPREALQQGTVLVSLQGEPIAADYVGRPFVNGAAVLGSAELKHGVVHFIDRVL